MLDIEYFFQFGINLNPAVLHTTISLSKHLIQLPSSIINLYFTQNCLKSISNLKFWQVNYYPFKFPKNYFLKNDSTLQNA